jgi:hypothetical protein
MIVKCCVILHNVCIRDWLTSKADSDGNYIPAPPHHDEEDDEIIQNQSIMSRNKKSKFDNID